jgi:hypothetical protein
MSNIELEHSCFLFAALAEECASSKLSLSLGIDMICLLMERYGGWGHVCFSVTNQIYDFL